MKNLILILLIIIMILTIPFIDLYKSYSCNVKIKNSSIPEINTIVDKSIEEFINKYFKDEIKLKRFKDSFNLEFIGLNKEEVSDRVHSFIFQFKSKIKKSINDQKFTYLENIIKLKKSSLKESYKFTLDDIFTDFGNIKITKIDKKIKNRLNVNFITNLENLKEIQSKIESDLKKIKNLYEKNLKNKNFIEKLIMDEPSMLKIYKEIDEMRYRLRNFSKVFKVDFDKFDELAKVFNLKKDFFKISFEKRYMDKSIQNKFTIYNKFLDSEKQLFSDIIFNIKEYNQYKNELLKSKMINLKSIFTDSKKDKVSKELENVDLKDLELKYKKLENISNFFYLITDLNKLQFSEKVNFSISYKKKNIYIYIFVTAILFLVMYFYLYPILSKIIERRRRKLLLVREKIKVRDYEKSLKDEFNKFNKIFIGKVPNMNISDDISKNVNSMDWKLYTYNEANLKKSDYFRNIVNNILKRKDKKRNCFLISSVGQSSGKTLNAANLASLFAIKGYKTLLIDANYFKPGVYRFFDIENFNGLSEFIINDSDNLKQTKIENLKIITTGIELPNQPEFFSSKKFRTKIEKLKSSFDFIFFDSSSFLDNLNSNFLLKNCDYLIFVDEYEKLNYSKFSKICENIDKKKILGYVVNNSK